MTNGIKIGEESFKDMNITEQNTILFRNTEQILLKLEARDLACRRQVEECAVKFGKIEKRKLVDKSLAGIAGAITGFFSQFIPK